MLFSDYLGISHFHASCWNIASVNFVYNSKSWLIITENDFMDKLIYMVFKILPLCTKCLYNGEVISSWQLLLYNQHATTCVRLVFNWIHVCCSFRLMRNAYACIMFCPLQHFYLRFTFWFIVLKYACFCKEGKTNQLQSCCF